MKINRRSFLSLGIGTAAGTAISPLPWKLTDDVSIWTQNWPWTPVPADGEVTYENSVCTLCPGGCGITVRKVEGRPVKIEGINGHPVNDGGLCLLGLSGLQLLYGEAWRVKSPLKRTGERGENKWETISWDDAISEIAEKLETLRADERPQSVACISGSEYGTVPALMKRFLTVYGSPNFIRTPSILDSYQGTFEKMHGTQAIPGFDVENADLVLSFGSGIIDGWGSPVRMFRTNSIRKENRFKTVQIEPRLSNTAANADQWIALAPGTEGVLALGLAHVILKESLYNKEFVNGVTSGFDRWKKAVLTQYTPELVSKITTVKPAVIQNLAREFAGASQPLAICGRGQGKIPGGLNEFMAVHALNALVGNINRKGGVWSLPEPDYIQWPDVEMDNIASAGLQTKRVDGAGCEKYPHTRHMLHRLPEVLKAAASSGEDCPVQLLLVADANPYYTLSDTLAVKEAFDNIPYIVSFSAYMDETAKNADLILPTPSYLEQYQDVPVLSGVTVPMIGLTRPIVDPLFDTKTLGDTLIAMANTMEGTIAGAFPWEDYQTCLEETLTDKWESLSEEGYWAEQDFAADSIKFEFPEIGSESALSAVQIPLQGDEATFPLILVAYDSMRLANGAVGSPPFVIKTVEDTVLKKQAVLVEVNPITAKTYGLSEDRDAELMTPRGSVKVKVHIFDGVMPGIVAMPRGLGHTAYDKYLADKGCNFNSLISPVEDPASGLDAVWGIRARLTCV